MLGDRDSLYKIVQFGAPCVLNVAYVSLPIPFSSFLFCNVFFGFFPYLIPYFVATPCVMQSVTVDAAVHLLHEFLHADHQPRRLVMVDDYNALY